MRKRKFISLIMIVSLLFGWCYILPASAEGVTSEVRVCAVGDNIAHSRVIKSGQNEDGTFDYSELYKYYDDYLDDYDVCIVNQETVFVEDDSDISSYPCFGTPEELGLALLDAGFNTVTTATNHVMDKGIDDLIYSHKFWTSWGIEPVGTYTYEETLDMKTGDYTENRAVYKEVNGIRLGLLNYTYGTNGIPIPDDYDYTIGTLYDKDLIKQEMEFARDRCDVLIVFPHWGVEYKYKPNNEQIEWAQFFADNGADIIIGTHPHVIEPLEYITSVDGRIVPCYYSLGNFMSNQDEVPRTLGAAASFTIVKNGEEFNIKNIKAIPTVTHISSYSEKFYAKALEDYTEEEEANHRMRRVKGEEFSIDKLWELWYSVFSKEQTGSFT